MRREQLAQRLVTDGLHEVGVESSRMRAGTVVVLAPAGHRDDENVPAPRLRAYRTARVVTVHPGEPEVEQDQLGPEGARALDRSDAIGRSANLVAVQAQKRRERFHGVR